MTAISTASSTLTRVRKLASRERLRVWLDVSVHMALLGAAVLVLVVTTRTPHENTWYLGVSDVHGIAQAVPLILIAAFAIITEFASTKSSEGGFALSGSLLGVVAAAVLGGPGPAVVVALLGLIAGWFQYREKLRTLLDNTTNFVWFALVAGLFFHSMQHLTGTGPRNDPQLYYLLVFATFVVASVTNIALYTVYSTFLEETPLRTNVPPVRPMFMAQAASAVLTLIAVFITVSLGWPGLALFGVILVVFQRLISDLWEAQLLANTDILTKLDNRNQFNKKLNRRIEAARESGESFGVLLLDLDRFRNINDNFGHEAGDDLLQTLASRLNELKEQLGKKTVIARFGGDEFAILPERRVYSAAELEEIAQSVRLAVNRPIEIATANELTEAEPTDEQGETRSPPTVPVEASIGVVRYPTDVSDHAQKGTEFVASMLVKRADIAMYAAKDDHHGYRLFDGGMESDTAAAKVVLSDFSRALENDELILVYHPIVDLGHRRVSGAEALVRWQHPQKGLLPPIAFINVVEQTNLIGDLTKQVLRKAVAECASWRAAGLDLTIGVNLSVRDLLNGSLPKLVEETLAEYHVPPASLKLEITESMIMYKFDEEVTVDTVRRLGALGVRIAVDDFGTGHSSLAKLRLLPIDELKIDRSFVTPMLTSSSDRVIVESTIRLGHDLGLKVIAEGVETAETLVALEKLGCDQAQGHFMSTPMQAVDFPEWCRAFEEGYRLAA